ncbi:MAG: glycosyltransferase family 2 protein [Clostridia bacterium]|nr:glycosyltransferase family 2 protein [Clostridia bacterium]
MQFIYFLQQAIIWLITIFYLYQLVISIFSFVKLKDKPFVVNKKHKFILILPAHNEEAVIANLVNSLKEQDYPKKLYDIQVIADNCTDNTEKIARDLGVKVFVRNEEDPAKRTKGCAMQVLLNTLLSDPKMDYDAFCVFDADNIVDKNFLKVMNKHLCQGEEVVQGYRDIKNPDDNWIASGYAIFYWMMNRIYHLARYNAGLSPLINGTGFMVKMSAIKDTGWNTNTLTEDIEFSLKTIIQGKKLGWAVDAVCYDEQPVQFKASWSQRSRWTIGHIQCLREYTGELTKAANDNRTLMNFDGLLYILGSIPMFICSIVLLLINAVVYLTKGMTTTAFVINLLRFVVPTFILPILVALFIMVIDKKPIKKMWFGLLMYPVFMASWLLINFKCLFKQDTRWEKIEHNRNVEIDDI